MVKEIQLMLGEKRARIELASHRGKKINPFSKKVNKTDRSAAPLQYYGWSEAKAPRF